MKFLTLADAVNVMVIFGGQPPALDFLKREARLYDPGYRDSDAAYRSICHRSCMAGRLHQLISNAPDDAALRWARQHPLTGHAVLDQSLATEALDTLARMGAYILDEYNAAVKIGPKGLSIERSRIVKYPDPRVKIFMPMVQKFAVVESDLIRLLAAAGFDLPVSADGTLKVAGSASGSRGASSAQAEMAHATAIADSASRGEHDDLSKAPTSPPEVASVKETNEDRQDRRLARLQELGSDRVTSGAGWKASGRRGALAKLAAEEAAAGRPYSDVRDVARDLDKAAERRHANRTMPRV